ncbi:MAG: aromatic-ring-hydroxylating dioxygenase subunit beta [Burkholderiaceae bacterium]
MKKAAKKVPVKTTAVKKSLAKKAPLKKAVGKAVAAKAAPRANPLADLLLQREVEQFLYRQSAMLDNKRWQDYIDLFSEDGLYWMPPAAHYTTWLGQPAIFVEDPDFMTVRMKRIQHPRAWSQVAEWATNHVVSNVEIEKVDANGDIHVLSRFHMMELRRDNVRHFGGTYRHTLVKKGGSFAIKMQRVDLFNGQAPFDYVLQIWV